MLMHFDCHCAQGFDRCQRELVSVQHSMVVRAEHDNVVAVEVGGVNGSVSPTADSAALGQINTSGFPASLQMDDASRSFDRPSFCGSPTRTGDCAEFSMPTSFRAAGSVNLAAPLAGQGFANARRPVGFSAVARAKISLFNVGRLCSRDRVAAIEAVLINRIAELSARSAAVPLITSGSCCEWLIASRARLFDLSKRLFVFRVADIRAVAPRLRGIRADQGAASYASLCDHTLFYRNTHCTESGFAYA